MPLPLSAQWRLLWRGADICFAHDREYPECRLRITRFSPNLWSFNWKIGGTSGHFNTRAVTAERTLTSLSIVDSASGLRQAAVPLPEGQGMALFLEGETTLDVALTLSEQPLSDAIDPESFFGPFQFHSDRIAIAERTDGTALAAAGDFLEDGISPSGSNGTLFRLKRSRPIVVIFCFGPDRASAIENAEKFAGLPRTELEADARKALGDLPGFTLATDDEQLNKAFALLTAALAFPSDFLEYRQRQDYELNAQMAAGLFLASGSLPPTIFEKGFAKKQNLSDDMIFRWSWPAYDAAIRYGMGDKTKNISDHVLEGIRRLEEDYDRYINILNDETIPDSLLRLAASHIELAGILTLAETVYRNRGDFNEGDNYRKAALTAARKARKKYHALQRKLRDSRTGTASTQTDLSESTSASSIETLNKNEVCRNQFIFSGAKAGFKWLDNDPSKLISEIPANNFIQQRWLGYRMLNDPRVTQTTDLDALTDTLLSGGSPGILTPPLHDPLPFETSEFLAPYDQQPDYLGMAAAFQNLSEIYVGVIPNWFGNRVTIHPRLPNTWGRMHARVPFGTGFIHLDFDFLREQARIGLSGIDTETDISFSYPLSDDKQLPANFKLGPRRWAVVLKLKREADNRLRFDIKSTKLDF